MTNRQMIISAILVLVILLIAGASYQKLKSSKKSTVSDTEVTEEITTVITSTFTPETITSKITVDGRLNAFEKIDVAAEVTGRLLPINQTWRKGSYFSKGDLLFQIDSGDDLFNLYAQRSSLLNAITQIMPDLKFDYSDAFEKWKKYLDAFDSEKTTPALPSVSSDQEKYFVAGKNIYNLYYSIKSAEDRLKHFNVYAPFSGVFLTVDAYPGSIVNPGGVLGRIMNTSRFELETPINLNDFDYVKVGQKVSVSSNELGKDYDGVISRISSQIDQTTQSIPIYISVTGKGLRDGMYLKGTLIGNDIPDVAMLPKECIVNQNILYVLENGTIREKEIEIVLRADEGVMVRGLDPNDQIVVQGLNSLSPGQKATASN